MNLLFEIVRDQFRLDKSEWHEEFVFFRHKDIQGNMIRGNVLQRKTPMGWQYRSMEMTKEDYEAWAVR